MTVAHRGSVGLYVGRQRPVALAAIALCIATTGCQLDAPTSATTTPSSAPSLTIAGAAVVPGQYIVMLRGSEQDVAGAAAQLLDAGNARLGHIYRTAIKGFSATMSEQAAAALANNPRVASIEPDMVVEGYDI